MTTLTQHFTKVKWIQAVLIALPAGLHLSNFKIAMLNPPLGPLEDLVVPLAFVITATASFLPWLIRTKTKAKRAAWISGFSCFICLFLLALCIQKSVVRLDIPSVSSFVLVSVGSERSDFAKLNLPGLTDAEMLHERGFTEGDIHFLWTNKSILKNRLELLVSYIGTLALLNFFIGALATASESSVGKASKKA